ncbi:Myosin-binding protein 7 [Linum grandiflorum]
MAETHHALLLPETDAITLKEALQAQQQILQKLYRELDDEREAAATAASEAMSMILRLQGEKAALKMEANQYMRMAEEKMTHAEETLDLCDDLMYQKEMEIASLEFQVQSYKNMLVGMGVNDVEVPAEPDHQQPPQHTSVRRLNSLPQLAMVDFGHKKIGLDRKQKQKRHYHLDLASTIDEEAEFQEIHELEKKLVAPATHGDINSCWEQIKKLDQRLKGISDGTKDHHKNKPTLWRGGTWSHSSYSQETTAHDLEAALTSEDCSNESVHKSGEEVKTVMHCSQSEKKAPKDAPVVVDHHGLPPHPVDYQKLMRRIERLERAKNKPPDHVSNTTAEEEMQLLKAIQEQLGGIQTELRSRKAQRSDEPCLDELQEAMLFFWL